MEKYKDRIEVRSFIFSNAGFRYIGFLIVYFMYIFGTK